MPRPHFLLTLRPDGAAFPPGRRFSPQRFWCAAPVTQDNDASAHRIGPNRPAQDFIASGEANMLSWSPPSNARYVEPLANTQSLVRFLGGLPNRSFPPGDDPSAGDVVYRTANGSLAMRWPLVFRRLDPFVNNSIAPIIVLDNVPFAFAAPGAAMRPTGFYGNNKAPQNTTEYGDFIRALLAGIVQRYGDAANSFWFRVGTEPDTQPGHWNDTNARFVAMYAAVAEAVAEVVPGAKIGPGNFAADGPSRAESWSRVVVPIVQGIVASEARISYLAMSSYGRAVFCREWSTRRLGLGVDRNCEYSQQFSAETAQRLASLRALLPAGTQGLPLQVMEYGDQQNRLGNVDSQPGAWGGAWTLMSSVQFALQGIERAFHWGFGDRYFANGRSICPKPLTRCGLYGGNIWVAAAAGRLFGGDNATVLEAENRTNGTSARAPNDGGVTASGIGGWDADGGELRLLITIFDPRKDHHTPAKVSVSFDQPSAWSSQPPRLMRRAMLLNETTSVYDAIRRNASAAGTLRNSSDPNVYALKKMLTASGLAATKSAGERWLAMQNATFSPSPWTNTTEDDEWQVACDSRSSCTVSFVAAPPAVVALWLRPYKPY